MKPCVLIHTTHRKYIGALVSAHSIKRNSKNSDQFEVKVINHQDYGFFFEHEGQPYLRDGVERHWRNDDLQSFTPLRFMPPELMDYQGRAVVVDPGDRQNRWCQHDASPRVAQRGGLRHGVPGPSRG